MEISEVANAFLGSLEGTLGGGGEEIRKRGIVLFVFFGLAYGSSQARGQIRAAVAGLHHSSARPHPSRVCDNS